jgi:hypothetical protein
MDTTRTIKLFVVLEVILLISYLSLSWHFESHLPGLLVQYLNQDSLNDWSILGVVTGFLFLALYVAAIIGLLLTKVWAKTLYVVSFIAGYALFPFLDPTVEHAISATFSGLLSATEGFILALLFFTSSAFSKPENTMDATLLNSGSN